jgi:hypothetical protein
MSTALERLTPPPAHNNESEQRPSTTYTVPTYASLHPRPPSHRKPPRNHTKTVTRRTGAASEDRESLIRQRCGGQPISSIAQNCSAPRFQRLRLSCSVDQRAAGAVQQHSNCRRQVREPSVAALRAAPGLVSSEREQRPLYTPPQQLCRRIRTAFVKALHSRASILPRQRAHSAFFFLFEQFNSKGNSENCTGEGWAAASASA